MTTRLPRKKTNRQLPRFFYRWHRSIGVFAALFLVWIVISGLLLNHSDGLHLAQHNIKSLALSRWYNISALTPTHVFNSEHHWLLNSDDMLIIDGKKLSTNMNSVIGFSENENVIAIANNSEIFLFDSTLELIDKLSGSNLPIKNISHIGTGCDGITITDDRESFFTQDGIEWKTCSKNIAWSTTQELNPNQLKNVESILTPEISVEKIIIDLHTGRFFGRFGAYFVDAIGLCLMLLALSGLWLFFKMGQRK